MPERNLHESAVVQRCGVCKICVFIARGVASATLRTAKITHDQQQVPTTQDLPIPIRARKIVLLGLRWQLGEWRFLKRESESDTNYTKLLLRAKQSSNFIIPKRCASGMGAVMRRLGRIPKQCSVATDHGHNQFFLQKQGKGTGRSKNKDAGAAGTNCFLGSAPFEFGTENFNKFHLKYFSSQTNIFSLFVATSTQV